MKTLSQQVADFLKLAESTDYEYNNTLRKTISDHYNKDITADAGQFLNQGVSSITITFDYNSNQPKDKNTPKLTLVVNSTGANAAMVDAKLGSLLNAKYSSQISKLISNKEPSFKFNWTVE